MRQVFKQRFSNATDLEGRKGTGLLLDKFDGVVTAVDVYRVGDTVYVEISDGETSYKGRQTITAIAPDGNKQMVVIDAPYQGDASGTIERVEPEPFWAADTSFGRKFLIGSLIVAAVIFGVTSIKNVSK